MSENIERIKRPWVFDRRDGYEPRDYIPWDRKRWFVNTITGLFREIQFDWDPDSRTSIRKLIDVPTGAPELSKDDMDAIFKISEESDCSFMRAAIAHCGEDQFTPSFIQEALRAPDCRALRAVDQPKHNQTQETLVFVDPRKEAKTKTAEPGPQPTKKRKSRERPAPVAQT